MGVSKRDIQQYVDGELSAEQAAELERLAASDEELNRELSRARRLHELLVSYGQTLQAEAEAADLVSGVRQGLDRAPSATLWERLRWSSRWNPWPAMAAAALVVVVALAGLLWVLPRRGASGHHAGARPTNQLVVEDYEGPPPTVFQIPDHGNGTTVLWVQSPKEEGDATDSESGGSI